MSSFPFTAVVGQEKLKESLVLNAINPAIGGVLIFGEKGTAKSTTVRGLKSILEFSDSIKSVPLVEMPLSSTEEMVVGTINIPETLKSGKTKIEYGLLHKANNGIIYIDEVNLLEDHLVNIILDAAAMGVNRIEREGISHEHPSNFILTGTMNPEEGELRPQLLDRFGISVQIKTETDLEIRKEIIRRRLAWEKDKVSFVDKWSAEEAKYLERIEEARSLLPKVNLPDYLLDRIVELTVKSGSEGHRAELVMTKTAIALAAWNGRLEVIEEDVYKAAEYALNHRGQFQPPANNDSTDSNNNSSKPENNKSSNLGNNESSPEQESSDSQKGQSSFQSEQDPAQQRFETLELLSRLTRQGTAGKNTFSKQTSEHGRTHGYSENKKLARGPSDIAFFPTLVAGIRKGKKNLSQISLDDLRYKRKISGNKQLHLLVVDTSASMGTQDRLSFAKGLVQRILKCDYQKKNLVAIVGTEGVDAKVFLRPTRNVFHISKVLDSISAKGKTPLIHAMNAALKMAEGFAKKKHHLTSLMVIISDGRVNVPFRNSISKDLDWLADRIRKLGLLSFVVDSNTRFAGSALLRKIANTFHGRYVLMADVHHQEKIML